MPIFSYKCQKCGHIFDLLEGMTVRKAEKKCSKCGNMKIERIFSAFSVGSSSGGAFSSGASCPTGTCPL